MDELPLDALDIHAPAAPWLLRPLFVAASFIAAVVFFCVPRSMADSDIWWHLRDAQLQLSSHSFLTHDVFSFTAAGSAWMNHEWLAELPFYAGFSYFGVRGLYFVTLLVIEAIFLGLLYLTHQHSKSIAHAAFVTLLGVLLSTVSFGPRTLLLGWLLLVAELLLLQRAQRDNRALWALPFLFMLWVNTHGSWLIGIILFALFIAANCFAFSQGLIDNPALSKQQLKRLAIFWLASVAALFINPYGWRLVFYPFDLAFRQKLNVANIEEWKSLDFHTPRGRILFLCLALLFLFQLIRKRKWTLFELGLLALGLYSGFTYSRFLFLAAILIGPLLAKSMASDPGTPRRTTSPLVGFAVAFLVLCTVVGRIRTLEPATTDSPNFPTKALPYLSTFHPQGRLLNEFTWGGFLIWHERHIPVFIDSRVDIFEYNGTFKDYLDITHLKDPIALLNKHQIQYVLFKKDSPLVTLLKATSEWKVDYEDPTATLLERTTPLP